MKRVGDGRPLFGYRRQREMGGTGLRAVAIYPTISRQGEVVDFSSTVSAESAAGRKGSSDRVHPTGSADDGMPSPSLTVPPRHPAALGEN